MRPNTAALARRLEQRMTARVRIGRPGEPGGWNDDTGSYDPPTAVTVYEGKAYVRPTRKSADAESVGQQLTVHTVDVMLPRDVPTPDFDLDTLTVLESEDPDLTGLVLPILRGEVDDWHTARLLVCQRAV